MVILTSFVNGKILWIIILVVQILFTAVHFVKLYESWNLYLQSILREIYLLAVVSLLFASKLTPQSPDQQKKELKALVILSTVQTIIFVLVALSNLIYKIVIWIKTRRAKKTIKV